MTNSHHNHKHDNVKNTVRIGLQKPIHLIVEANFFPVRENLMSITDLRKHNKLYAYSSIHTKSNANCPE